MKIRARALTKIPATLQASGGLKVEKTNGRWTFGPDWNVLALETTLPDAASRHLWTLNPNTGVYTRLSVQALVDNLPQGPAGETAVGTVTALDPGATPTVTNSGTPTHAVLDFGLPVTPTIAVGTVTTVGSSDPATVTNSGTLANVVLDFDIPKGPPGAMGGPGSSVDSEIAIFDGTTGTSLKRANQTGVLKATSGVISTASSSDITSLVDAASDTAAGKVELATAAEVATGTDNTRAATPSGISNSAIFGIIPVESKTADYTLTASDQSKLIFHSGTDANNRTFTIPANASVAFPIGTVITFANRINTVTISITSDTLVWAPSGATGTRTLAANGIATATKLTSTLWTISGAGLS